MMTEVPADSFDAVAQKGVALEGLTQATGEVSEDAQVKSSPLDTIAS